jgi:hypothetical protein
VSPEVSHPLQEPGMGELATLALVLIVAALYRRAFGRLPLHRDTGFYVPNYSVQTGRFGPFRGWNTYFSGGSRALPQLVHTAIYLKCGSEHYPAAYRALYTTMAWCTALATAWIVGLVVGPSRGAALAGLMLSLALLSETQYGVYFESAEAFEVLFQATGIALVLTGIAAQSSWLTMGGLLLLWTDVVAVKLTGAGVAGAVSAAVLWIEPGWWPGVVGLGLAAVGSFLLWVRASGVGIRRIFHFLGRHEAYVRRNYPSPLRLMAVKVAFALWLMLRNPVIPALAAVGMWQAGLAASDSLPGSPLVLLLVAYGAGLVVAFLRQGHRVWYYQIPSFPILAVLATYALTHIAPPSTDLVAAALVPVAASALINLWARLRLAPEAFNRRVFSVYNRPGARIGDEMAGGNWRIARFAEAIHDSVAGHTMLVVGPLNQASVLCDAGYDTPLTSLCDLSHGVAGEFEPWLGETLDRDPPELILITSEEDWKEASALLEGRARYEPVAEREGMRLLRLADRAAA